MSALLNTINPIVQKYGVFAHCASSSESCGVAIEGRKYNRQ